MSGERSLVSTFRAMSTRGAFVPSATPGAAARAFSAMPMRSTTAFVAGLSVRGDRTDVAGVRPQDLDGAYASATDGADEAPPAAAAPQADETRPAAPETPAPTAPAPAPTYTSAAARLQADALAEAIQQAERAAAELAERDALRAAEHAQLLADLDAQKQKAKATSERLGQLAGEMVRARAAMIEEVRTAAGTLLLTGARRLAGEALRAQPGLLEGLVTEIVDSMAADTVTLRVNPADVERLGATFGDRVRVVGDPAVAAGCIAQGDAGSVDASVDTGLGALAGEVSAWKRTA